MSFRVLGIDHVVIVAAERERALRFYRDVLGCRIERDRPELGLIQLRAGASQIDLTLAKDGAPRAAGVNMDHFCLRIDPFEEVALADHLRRHGVEPGPVMQRLGADGTGPSMYIRDPDGNMVELKGPPLAPK